VDPSYSPRADRKVNSGEAAGGRRRAPGASALVRMATRSLGLADVQGSRPPDGVHARCVPKAAHLGAQTYRPRVAATRDTRSLYIFQPGRGGLSGPTALDVDGPPPKESSRGCDVAFGPPRSCPLRPVAPPRWTARRAHAAPLGATRWTDPLDRLVGPPAAPLGATPFGTRPAGGAAPVSGHIARIFAVVGGVGALLAG
jgi:hypothetical protein